MNGDPRFLAYQLVQAPQQSAAACEHNAPVNNIRRQLRRGLFQSILDGVHHDHHAVHQGLPHLVGMNGHILRQAVDQVPALDLHKGIDGILRGKRRADLHLDLLGGTFADEQVIFLFYIGDDGLVKFIARHAHGNGGNDISQGDHGHFGGAAADVHHHAAGSLPHGQARADSCRHGLLDQIHIVGAGLTGGVLHCPALHFRNSGGNADHDPGPAEGTGFQRLFDKVFQHCRRYVEVGDHAVLQGTHRHDGAGGPAQHFLGLLTHRQNLIGTHVHGHHGGFPHYNALAPHKYQRIGSSQINADILGKHRKHGKKS